MPFISVIFHMHTDRIPDRYLGLLSIVTKVRSLRSILVSYLIQMRPNINGSCDVKKPNSHQTFNLKLFWSFFVQKKLDPLSCNNSTLSLICIK